MTPAEKKYMKMLGDMVEYDYQCWDSATVKFAYKPVIIIPTRMEKIAGWWFFHCQLIGDYDGFYHRDGMVRIACNYFKHDIHNTLCCKFTGTGERVSRE